MSTEPLQWSRINDYYLQAPHGYTLCKIGTARGFTYECWKAQTQLQVGLRSADAAKAWCQRHHDEQQERSNADVEPPTLLAGQ